MLIADSKDSGDSKVPKPLIRICELLIVLLQSFPNPFEIFVIFFFEAPLKSCKTITPKFLRFFRSNYDSVEIFELLEIYEP